MYQKEQPVFWFPQKLHRFFRVLLRQSVSIRFRLKNYRIMPNKGSGSISTL